MIETEHILEKLHWKASQDNSHQSYLCEPHSEIEFKELVSHIRKHGYVVTIQGKSYVCLDIGEYLYWTMWDTAENTNLINRMHV